MKRGVTSSLVIVILFVVSVVILSAILIPLYGGFGERLGDVDCAAQVRSHNLQAKFGRTAYPPIDCPTQRLQFDGSEEDEVVRGAMADALARCWKVWGRGDLELFEDEGVYCHPCAYLDFTARSEPVTGLNSYLFENSPEGSQQSYIEYLSPSLDRFASEAEAYQLSADVQHRLERDAYGADTPWAVIFVYAKGSEAIRLVNYAKERTEVAQGAGVLALAAGGVAGVKVAGLVTTLGASGPVGWGILAAGATGGALFLGTTYVASQFDPYDFSDRAALVSLEPVNDDLFSKFNCSVLYSTS